MRALLGVVAAAVALHLLARRRRGRRATVPHAFVISLGRRPAKRASVLARCADAGLKALETFEAVDGRDLTPESMHGARGAMHCQLRSGPVARSHGSRRPHRARRVMLRRLGAARLVAPLLRAAAQVGRSGLRALAPRRLGAYCGA